MNANLFLKKIFRTLGGAGVILLMLATANVFAADGALDPTFGTNGIVITDYGSPSSANEVVLQADGKIITLTTVALEDASVKKILTRYQSDGTPDTSFGTNGNTTLEVDSFSGSKMALQPDGKIIVGGLSGADCAAVRYLSNGTLDTSFGVNGLGIINGLSESRQSPSDLAIQPDGKIIMVGYQTTGQSNYDNFFIVRFDSNGAPDSTFGYRILDQYDFPNSRYNYAKAVGIQPDGKIVISGNMMDNDGKNQISLARLNSNGSLDSTFGTNGRGTVTTPANFLHSSGALALQPDGKIIVAGTLNNADGSQTNLALVRYNPNGSLDSAFGAAGMVISDFGGHEWADDLILQPDGKIILDGKITSQTDPGDFLLTRYNTDGSLDTTFGTNGKSITHFESNDNPLGMARQPDNKIIVAGTSGENAILARYENGTPATTSFTFKSINAYDGWVLESAENSNKGRNLDKASNFIYVGDDAKKRQYRGFLSFDTASLPDNAIITAAQVKIKKHSTVGITPFKTHGDLLLEIRNGTFSNNILLKAEDFSAIANIGSSKDKFLPADLNGYSANLSNINLGFINKYGVTQFRLLFTQDDNNDKDADYVKFFSGSSSADAPQLVITYTTSDAPNLAPVLNGGSALSISIPENTTTVTAVSATDPEGQPISYSILGADASIFSISRGTGTLTFLTAPNFESIPLGRVYRLTAQASDGSLTAAQNIEVTVTGINEFAPVVTSYGGGSVTQISLPENTLEAATLSATDTDLPTPTLEYVISGGADGQMFTLDVTSGKLSFVTAPIYNAPNDTGLDHTYNVKVEISDGESATALDLVISILNPNPTLGFTALHQFGAQAGNGRIPYGSLAQYNGFLYGTTTYGGAPYNQPPTNPANKGNLFRMNLNGSAFTILHEFSGGNNDGWKPWSGLAFLEDRLFGSTVYGGPHGEAGGVIYEMKLDGSRFGVMHAFGDPGDGFGGSTAPIRVGDTLYGLTRWGGNGTGSIYSHNLTTEDYTQLYRFAPNGSDGSTPLGTLTAANDGYLYGLTWLGGKNNLGTLFRIKPDGAAFETLHHFSGGTQGKYPYDSLVFDGKHTLYGATLGDYGNNPSDLGALFKYDLNSKTYTVLHKFGGGDNDSGKPNGSVVLAADGVTLYGTAHGDDAWGGKEFGILYQMNIDGTGFIKLHEFGGGQAGKSPMQTPLLIDGALYGMTAYGGAENYGLIYRYQLTETATAKTSANFAPVNLYPPVFTSPASFAILENNTAITAITAADADLPAQALTYSISGGADAALFAINAANGAFTFLTAPDYEMPKDANLDNIHEVIMQVSDGVSASQQTIFISVTRAENSEGAVNLH